MNQQNSILHKAGWRVREWHPAAGFSKSKTWELINDGRLPSVMVDGMRIITMSPADFLRSQAKAI